MSDWDMSMEVLSGKKTHGASLVGTFGLMGPPASAVWSVANRALFVPFRITSRIGIKLLWLFNGAVVNGNLDMGIYDAVGKRIVSTGSQAQAGVSQLQSFATALTWIGPGLFYKALVFDNVVAQAMRMSETQARYSFYGLATMAAAFTLPDPAVFASVGLTAIPPYLFGYSTRTFV
jgi:hypothetical protein